ncbi:MAG: recombinase family protein [Chroococcidiopsidaceae cyanobacterium CP_BM_RX_35]|nr:recombinase family protein [Chroococcidiopsidaceae cyanobacterium CP_BM_RX_35]
MLSDSVWIDGPSYSGKTTRLVKQFCTWVQKSQGRQGNFKQAQVVGETIPSLLRQQLRLDVTEPAILIFAANDEQRHKLADQIVTATQGKYPVRAKTPLGFFQDETILFWPLLLRLLNLKAQFPVRLRPETEQELATWLWHPELEAELPLPGVSESQLVRRLLDLLQLAAYSGTPPEEIANLLEQGELLPAHSPEWAWGSKLLLGWRNWCLERGLLTYGIMTELYWRHLLPAPDYQQHLIRRYRFVLADDVDDYPGVARHLFDLLLNQGVVGAFTFNSDGAVRLGLGADPQYLEGLRSRCQVETLTRVPLSCLAETLSLPIVEFLDEPISTLTLPSLVQSIQTTSRAALLRQTAELIVAAVKSGQVQPKDVAVIAPGLDAIARYTLVEILTKQGIPVNTLSDQRPLISSPMIRALLTVLALIYSGLGRLVERSAVAEMLVVLSKKIDPVRAGLLADYCFEPHPDRPNLLPVTVYDRWDRLGYEATTVYGEILQWLDVQRHQQEQHLIPSPISVLDRAIQKYLWNNNNLPYDEIAALRELLETAQHYWEVDRRLRQSEVVDAPAHTTIAQFIQLLRRGTITANPYPVRSIGLERQAVTLSNIFQYRSSRQFHRWHFWLDAGSPLWLSGGAATLFGAQLFLQHRFGRPWTAEEASLADEQRLRRILPDLLGRVGEQIYLCHSDLAVNGQEQTGPLLSLVNAAVPLKVIKVNAA